MKPWKRTANEDVPYKRIKGVQYEGMQNIAQTNNAANTTNHQDEFLDTFTKLIESQEIDKKNPKTKLSLFVHTINANSFDYSLLVDRLLEPLIDYSLSRKTIEKLKNKPAHLSAQARQKFVKKLNTGELGELLLYCFLKKHLKAPKILSKLELKTSNKLYVNGSDGIHFLKLDNGNYQLIFGESKTIKDLPYAIRDALQSIYDFKNEANSDGEEKSGINFEKSLISTHLEKEDFTDEERKIIEDLIYPKESNNFFVDDAFGVFIGYEIPISTQEKALPNIDFRNLIHQRVKDAVIGQFKNISKKIDELGLNGHCFYLYVLPFTDLEKTRSEIIKSITE